MKEENYLDRLAISAGRLTKERDYWLAKLAGDWQEIGFPFDYRPPQPEEEDRSPVEVFTFTCDESLTNALSALSTGSDARLFMVLLAGLYGLLYRYHYIFTGVPATNQPAAVEIPVGAPILRPDLEETELLNRVLVLKSSIRAGMTFKELLLAVRQTVSEADEHKNYPLEILAKQIGKPFSNARDFSLFDVALLLENIHEASFLDPYAAGVSMIFMFRRNDTQLTGKVVYQPALYAAASIHRCVDHLMGFLKEATGSIDTVIDRLDFLSPVEKKNLLIEFNHSGDEPAEDFPRDKTLHQLFAEQSAKTPGHVALVLGEEQWTYRQLHESSDAAAAGFIEKGVMTGDIIAIMAERSVEVISGILGILKAGAAYLPVDPDYPEERKQYILNDSAAKLFIKGKEISKEKRDRQENVVLSRHNSSFIIHNYNKPLAYIIYTSGSTGRPKGVMIEHGAAVNLAYYQAKYFKIDGNDRVLQFSSLCFDASVEQIFIALLNGAALVLVDKGTLLNEEKFSYYITRQSITHLHAVPSFLDTLQVRADYPMKRVIAGGDSCSFSLVEKWAAKHAFYNEYGPTETTVTSVEMKCDPLDPFLTRLPRLPIGKPVGNTPVFILDGLRQLVPTGAVGELFIGGAGVARGYLNNPELTAEKFVSGTCTLLALQARACRAPLYRTGDLCRWLPGGNLDFIGRIDSQVKVRGFRIECGEIENRLLQHEGVKEALALVRRDNNGENYLCAYIVSQSAQGTTESCSNENCRSLNDQTLVENLRHYLSSQLPHYMIPTYFVVLEQMPLNANGKIDRKALPLPTSGESNIPYVPARDEVEERIAAIWADVLGLDKQPGIDDNFFTLGGHSLKATTLVYNIYKEFAVNVEIEDVFQSPTIREIAAKLKSLETTAYTAVTPIEEKEYYPLSYAQRRLWVLCQFEADSTAYNMPFALTLCGFFDAAAFEQAVQTVANRHDSFRTVFVTIDGQPRQRVIRKEDFHYHLEQVDLRHLPQSERETETRRLYSETANRVFHLETGPLFYFKVIRQTDQEYILVFNMHHIVNDGWSQGIINKEMITLYNFYAAGNDQGSQGGQGDRQPPAGTPSTPSATNRVKGDRQDDMLPSLELQYKDYTEWHNHLIESESFGQSRDYWLQRFKDKANGIELPYDHPRQAIQTFNGGRVAVHITGQQTHGLYRLCTARDATLFMGLLTLVSVFIYRFSGQPDILIGAPIANRKRPELGQLVGFLVNTLVYRVAIDAGQSFDDVLQTVKNETLAAYRYQDYPFDLLIEELGLERDLSQSPLFNVMLAHNNAETGITGPGFDRLTVSSYRFSEEFNMSKFDLIFFMDEQGEDILTLIEYNSDLFERSTIERMGRNFLAFIDQVTAGPAAPVSLLGVMSEPERETVIGRFNDSHYDFPKMTLAQMFAKQVQKNPNKIAVLPPQAEPLAAAGLTYQALGEKANRLAHYLLNEYGVKTNDILGISMDRSGDMIVVILGVIISGAAYLAVDPSYPRERVLHVLADSRCRLLITDRIMPQLFGDFSGKILDIQAAAPAIAGQPAGHPGIVNQPTDILYVNYTSGSTGTPNGAMLSHDCLTNLIQWQQEKTGIDCSLRVLQFTSINFCVSFQEIMGTLTTGGELHLIGDIERQDIDYLMDFLVHHGIEVLFLPFSYLNFLFNESSRWDHAFDHSLKHIITAGEQLKITAGLKRFLDKNPHIRLHNHYGSTEMHVVTSYTLDASTAGQTPIPPAGKPISNVQIFILDEYFQPVPVGVYGELCVAGRSEILGYINNEELSNKKLITLPHLAPVRLYRSGDIGRWLPDGNIELRGRKDFMVKIRGFRIEPGEIESKLLAIDKVRECVVVVKEDELKQQHLVAYVSLDPGAPGHYGAAEIRRQAAAGLPQYMVPQVVILHSLPLMPNGKVDRDRLPKTDLETGKDRVIVPPANDTEGALLALWSELLGIASENISVEDNFFELGGHSLKATTMMSRIHQQFDVKVELIEIFKTPTIREIANLVKAIRWVSDTGNECGDQGSTGSSGEEAGNYEEIIL